MYFSTATSAALALVATALLNAQLTVAHKCKASQQHVTIPKIVDAKNGSNSTQSHGQQDDGSSSSSGSTSGKVYSVKERFAGITFFDGFDFESFPDPTHGNVNYLPRENAYKSGLAYVQDDDVVVMKVDNTKHVAEGGNRDSVRITSKSSYSSGLIILDVQSMPFGCGVWPAFWTVGEGWPNGGEIDILEGVNNAVRSHYTLHTSPGCQIDRSFEKLDKRMMGRYARSMSPSSTYGSSSVHARRAGDGKKTTNADHPLAFTGTVLTQNCDATVNSNIGCGIQDPDDKSYGSALNSVGGGVFATQLNDDGVGIWFFPRAKIPSDITALKPQPSKWGAPKAFWSSSACPTKSFFKAQKIVINTTLCGDWAGNVYSSDGCPGTCAQRVMNPKNFDTAQWKIRSVTVYN